MHRLALVLVVALVLPATASAQDLATGLAARVPSREIVPQSCVMRASEPIALEAGRICVRDCRSGLVRAVRRIALSELDVDSSAAAHGGDVYFAVTDRGGARTRFAGRVWRWDVEHDAHLGLANIEEARVLETSFGALYSTRAGWRRAEAAGASSPVTLVGDAENLAYSSVSLVHDGVTYAVRQGDRTDVLRLSLDGSRVRTETHTSLPGQLLYAGRGTVVTAVQVRGGAIELRVLRLPATEPSAHALPPSLRRPTAAELVTDETLRVRLPRDRAVVVDLASSTVTEASAEAVPAGVLRASSLHVVQPTASGLYVGTSSVGYLLDGAGVTRAPRAPRASRARCRCTDAELVCGEVHVAGACADVQELESIRTDDGYPAPRATQFTSDGRFRIDRLEADHLRVTRLADGARLWVRMLEGALLAQLDDGSYFTTERALEPRLALRDGPLTTGIMSPLAPRADSLFREALIAEFFAGPAAT